MEEICVNGAPAGISQGKGFAENLNNVEKELILQENDSAYELICVNGAPTGISQGQYMVENLNDVEQEVIHQEDESEYQLVPRAFNEADPMPFELSKEQRDRVQLFAILICVNGAPTGINQEQDLIENLNGDKQEICGNGAPAGSSQEQILTENFNVVKQEEVLQKDDSVNELVSRAVDNMRRVPYHPEDDAKQVSLQTEIEKWNLICVNGAPSGISQGQNLTENFNQVKQEEILQEDDYP
ncbi:hypothetical protein U1Q18_047257 [Sarracenia purpurea var. burkii]